MNLLRLSQVLIVFFVGSVTLWSCITPYLVNPHPNIVNDILTKTELANFGSNDKSSSAVEIENWTKWRLFVNTTESKHVIYGYTKTSVPISKSAVMNMEWRPEYHIFVDKDESGISAKQVNPSINTGIYNHFETSVVNNSIKVVPRFLFGLPSHIIEGMYGKDVSSYPIIGVFSEKPSFDRVIIQAYMNVVVLSVIFLLYANNPPNAVPAKAKAS